MKGDELERNDKMAQLTDEIKKAIKQQEYFPVATSSQNGIPNVVYIKYLKVVDAQSGVRLLNFAGTQREDP